MANRVQDLSRVGHSLGQTLKLEEDRAVAGEVPPPSEKDPEGWGASDKFRVVLETAGLNEPGDNYIGGSRQLRRQIRISP